jgi:hypothetical protein
LVKPLPVVPLADVAILTPPYSVIVPAFPTYIVTVGKPDPLAFADTAAKYHVPARIVPPAVQMLVGAVGVLVNFPPHSTHRSPVLRLDTYTLTIVFVLPPDGGSESMGNGELLVVLAILKTPAKVQLVLPGSTVSVKLLWMRVEYPALGSVTPFDASTIPCVKLQPEYAPSVSHGVRYFVPPPSTSLK